MKKNKTLLKVLPVIIITTIPVMIIITTTMILFSERFLLFFLQMNIEKRILRRKRPLPEDMEVLDEVSL